MAEAPALMIGTANATMKNVREEGTARARVLMVAPQPFFRVTGTPINVLFMCRALTEGGYQIDLLTLPDGEAVAQDGLVIRRVPRLPGVAEVPIGFSPAKAIYDILLLIWTLALLIRNRYAVVHGIEEADFFTTPLARLFGTAALTDLDSDLPQQLADHKSAIVRALTKPARWFRQIAIRSATVAISVARHMSEIAKRESPKTPVFEIHDIPMDEALRTPDANLMATLRDQLGLPGRRLIVYTGNYDRRQGLEKLIAAMPAVVCEHPEAALVVVGGKPEAVAKLRRTVEALGLENDVRLIGPQPPHTMAEYMGMAAVLASPRLEPHATPLKIFSYRASGRPIVATDLPTHTQVLDGTCAFLVPPTVEGLAQGLILALGAADDALLRGRKAKVRVAERHTFAVFKGQLLEAYGVALGVSRGSETLPDATAPRPSS